MTNGPEACHYVTNHSKAEVIVVEGNKQLKKYTGAMKSCPSVKAIVVYAERPEPSVAAACGVPVYFWDDFMKLGSDVPDERVDARRARVRPGNCASLIYTSGTTGPPKAVMISHDNITWTTQNIMEHYVDMTHKERVISYLPLSHIAAQLTDVFAVMQLGASLYFAQPDALKGSLSVTMKDVRPTLFFGVPRVWEKIHEAMSHKARQATGLMAQVAKWAKTQGAEKSRRAQFGNGGGAPCCFSCANALLLSKVKEALGLEECKYCLSAAAPIAPETLNYFAALDIPIYEGFGQSETTGPHSMAGAHCWKVGACGRPIKGSVTKLEPDTGEICYRGRHIFMGYMHMPEETAACFDSDGFLHSGDVAEIDADGDPDITEGLSGFIRITGRIKELIITAGGENVPPVLIENEMKAAMNAVSNCIAIGDRRKFLTMLVSLKVTADADGAPTNKLAADALHAAKQIGSSATTYSEATQDPKWIEYVNTGMKQGNSKTTSNAQIVQKWAWLPVDVSEKGGELTPTLKLKRKIVSEKYADLIESLYC